MIENQKIDSKRGIFTSKQIKEQKPSVLPYLQSSMQGVRDGLDNLRSMISNAEQQKNYLKPPLQNPLRLSQLNYQVHSSLHNLPTSQTNIGEIPKGTSMPPPPVYFNYSSGQQAAHTSSIYGGTTYTPIRGLPTGLINTQYIGQPQNIQFTPIKQNIQIIRRQVPLHIRNQIPARIVVNQPQYHQHQQRVPNPLAQSNLNQQAYSLLLKQYQKLYDRLQKQNQYTTQLQQQVRKYKEYVQKLHQQVQQQPTPKVQPQRKKIKYTLNIEELYSRLYRFYQKMVKEIINNRKRQARLKLEQAFASARKQITTKTIITQTISYK